MTPIERSAKIKVPAKSTALLFEVDAVAATKRNRLRISISSPYDTGKGDWACLFELRGIKSEEEKREYFGVDGLQALVLNLFYLRSVLARLRKNGYAFHETESGGAIEPEMYFDASIKPA